MNKYDCIFAINLLEIPLILGIVMISAQTSWWLLLLLLCVGTTEMEKRILASK